MFEFIKRIKMFLAKVGHKKILATSFVILFLLLVPNITHAGLFGNLIDIAAGAIGKLFFGISWFIALLGSFVIGILIWVLQIIILAGDGLVNSPAVQTGFPILLSVANLGFVLAVIMIAVATIVRNQSYGIKKFLVNVVIMAVAGNFGLVIAGSILGVSNRVTNYFLSSMTGGSPTKLASTIAGIVQPQRAVTSVSTVGTSKLFDSSSTSTETSTTSGAEEEKIAGGALGSFITPVIGAWMSILVVIILLLM